MLQAKATGASRVSHNGDCAGQLVVGHSTLSCRYTFVFTLLTATKRQLAKKRHLCADELQLDDKLPKSKKRKKKSFAQ